MYVRPDLARPDLVLRDANILGPVPRLFAAYCGTCEWNGRVRLNSLAALGDFDRHVLTLPHRDAGMARAILEDMCRDCGNAHADPATCPAM